ncbi:hypothetical protein [Gaopeijia maritima]|uniref:hypothetical protein n=1 Tax=Gaopeijia maritima TaxID=3119007 RepID=UPI00328A0CC1
MSAALEAQGIGWILSTLIGSGIAWWALRGRLMTLFQTREEAEGRKAAHARDIDRVEEKVEGVRVATDRAASRIDVLTSQVQGEKDRLSDLNDQVRSIESKVDRIAVHQAATAEALKGIGRSVDQLRDEIRSRP